jgi:hypothetical protein
VFDLIIDINMHMFPDNLFTDEAILESYLRIVPQAYGNFAKLTTLPGTDQRQIVIEKPRGYENLNVCQNFVDAKARLEIMDQAGLDKAILRVPCWQEWLSLEMCRQVNDSMAKVVKRHPDRFLGLATIPPWGDKDCLQELERCLNIPGFIGVEMAAHYGNLYLDDPIFRPYLRKLNELRIPVVVHHTPLPVEYHTIYEYNNFRRSIGRCIDQLIAVNRELFSGLFEECPNLKFIHTMLGGGVFAFTEQMLPRKSKEREEIERFDPQILKYKNYFRNNLYFEITTPLAWSKSQLECAVKEFGADHILYSSSYPIRLDWVLNGVEYVKSLNMTEEEKELIFCGNAKRLFNIE